jgi:hypothetical protein
MSLFLHATPKHEVERSCSLLSRRVRLVRVELLSRHIQWGIISVISHDADCVSVSPGKRVAKRFEDVKQSVPFWMSPEFTCVRVRNDKSRVCLNKTRTKIEST